MAKIILFTQEGIISKEFIEIDFDGTVADFIEDRYLQKCKSGYSVPLSIYHGKPCAENEISSDIEALLNGNGTYTIIETPAGVGAFVAASIVISIITAVAVIALTPDPVLPENVARNQESPNNQLASRSNKARPLERIPDIKGKVLSVPDLAAAPYSTYFDNQEIEHGLYCVGRKTLTIENLQDGDTPIELISGATAGIYYPFNSPNSGDPDVSINDHQSEQILSAFRSNQANGIVLSTEFSSSTISALGRGYSAIDTGDGLLFLLSVPDTPANWVVGAELVLDNFLITDGIQYDLSGLYVLTQKTYVENSGDPFYLIVIKTKNGAPVDYNGFFNDADSGSISLEGPQEFTDWIYLTAEKFDLAIINVVAPSGMYRDTGAADLLGRTVVYELQVEPVDESGNPSGVVQIIENAISGSDQRPKGLTNEIDLGFKTGFRARAKRITGRGTASDTVYVDEIKLEDVYGVVKINNENFGDVTLIQTITRATRFATSIRQRQLNCFATENLNKYEGNGSFSPDLTENRSAIQSFIADCIDPVIGRLNLEDIDADGLLAKEQEILSYFENPVFNEFNYTFDSTNITFQNYARTILDAINCIAFRESVIIKAIFEKPQSVPAMLFTHRSKKPDSETYSREFNQSKLNDGVEFNWTDYNEGITKTIFLPSDKSALNPKVFNIAGISNEQQAIVRANRELKKIRLAKQSVNLTVTGEGRYIKPSEIISIVKGTRVKTTDGEVLEVDQSGLVLTLSQDVDFSEGSDFSITLKKDDGTTENIIASEGLKPDQVVLDSLPTFTIRTGIDYQRRTEFSFAPDERRLAEIWLPQEIDDSDLNYVNIKAINYTDEYYSSDLIGFDAFSDGFSNGFS